MKMKLFAGFVAAMMLVPSAAHAMDCCKDGKCACCSKDKEAPKPVPESDHKH